MNNNKSLLMDLLTNVYNNVLNNNKDEEEIKEIYKLLSYFGDADFEELEKVKGGLKE